MELYKYQGAGNDFLIVDNRDNWFNPHAATISRLCDRHYGVGADGIMLLGTDPNYDFKMVYYNSDGTGGMMCGNGGRCIVAFAADLGIIPKNGSTYEFLADDGLHSAEILKGNPNNESESANEIWPAGKTIRLKMRDVEKVQAVDANSFFLDTGTRHFVRFVSELRDYNVFREGREIRNLQRFGPVGTNVNFVEAIDGVLNVRTYEKGVEAETCACGTGITASAIAALRYFSDDPELRAVVGQAIRRNPATNTGSPAHNTPADHIHIPVKALHDELAVDFIETPTGATDVWLTGPATFVGKFVLSPKP